jgi:hypothetical protein
MAQLGAAKRAATPLASRPLALRSTVVMVDDAMLIN